MQKLTLNYLQKAINKINGITTADRKISNK